ncbi:glycosyltransferase family 4 protein [Haladaptatus sp. CMAA 1911]|uniref:glycosyltransferase family 4 protein n=1 Tax=unclassified Haladaptatus TaxID=2622732 RepID=UPI003754E0E1
MAKICLVNGVYPPDEFGGAENYVQRTAVALDNRGHDVSILTTTSKFSRDTLDITKETRDGIQICRFYPLNVSHRSEGTGGSVFTKGIWHQLDTVNPHVKTVVKKFLEDQKPDVVHTNNFMGISTSAAKAISESDSRYVHTLHDYSLICPKSNLLRDKTLPGDELGVCENPPLPCRLYGKAKKRMLGQPDLVVGPSQHVIDIHREHGFFEGVESRRLQHGINSERFNCDVPVCETNKSAESTESVLYVGKHLRAKGIETLIASAERLPNVTFHLCGTGPFDTYSSDAAERLNNVKYHGFVSEERLQQLRDECAAAVVPSIWMENSPLTIYESFAVGLPVIGSNIGGIPELVDESRGRLFTPENDNELSRKISDLIYEADRGELRRNTRTWAKNRGLEDHITGLTECYNIRKKPKR